MYEWMDDTYDFFADGLSDAWSSTSDFFSGSDGTDSVNSWDDIPTAIPEDTYFDPNFGDEVPTSYALNWDSSGSFATPASPDEFTDYLMDDPFSFQDLGYKDYSLNEIDLGLKSNQDPLNEDGEKKGGGMSKSTKSALLTGALMLAKKYMTPDQMSQEELARLKHEQNMEMARLNASLRSSSGGGSNAADLEEARIAEHNKATNPDNVRRGKLVKL